MGVVYIVGAGVDAPLGVPLARDLMRELGVFATEEGNGINRKLRQKLGRFRFGFEKYAADQGENFAERLLSDDTLARKLYSALTKASVNPSSRITAAKDLLAGLESIRQANSLSDSTANTIAEIAGEAKEMADSTILKVKGVGMNPMPREAIVRILRGTIETDNLSIDEKEALGDIVAAMTDFEELLTELFAGFYTSNLSSQRKYLYVSWLLWTYMRWKSFAARDDSSGIPSFYDHLSTIDSQDSVVTFNYTDLNGLPTDRTIRFHGDCTSYIHYSQGRLIENDESITTASNLDEIEAFIDGLELDVNEQKLYLPAIVPPSAMKPVVNSAFIQRWFEAQRLMSEAKVLVAIGYAFNKVDNHFNDLFRASSVGKRIVIINPDLRGSRSAVCQLLGVDPDTLSPIRMGGLEVHSSDRLLFVPARSEDVNESLLSMVRSGW